MTINTTNIQQHATCNIQQSWELSANNVASVNLHGLRQNQNHGQLFVSRNTWAALYPVISNRPWRETYE